MHIRTSTSQFTCLEALSRWQASYWKHSVTAVCYAEELAAQGVAEFGSDFSVAAILHDFGKVVLTSHLTKEHCYFLRLQDQHLSASGVEQVTLSIDHAEVNPESVICGPLRVSDVRLGRTFRCFNPASVTCICFRKSGRTDPTNEQRRLSQHRQ